MTMVNDDSECKLMFYENIEEKKKEKFLNELPMVRVNEHALLLVSNLSTPHGHRKNARRVKSARVEYVHSIATYLINVCMYACVYCVLRRDQPLSVHNNTCMRATAAAATARKKT